MKVQELIDQLNLIKDKNQPVFLYFDELQHFYEAEELVTRLGCKVDEKQTYYFEWREDHRFKPVELVVLKLFD